jgi:hypothetical protein
MCSPSLAIGHNSPLSTPVTNKKRKNTKPGEVKILAMEEGTRGRGVCFHSTITEKMYCISIRISCSCVFHLPGKVVAISLPTGGIRKVLYLHIQLRLLH